MGDRQFCCLCRLYDTFVCDVYILPCFDPCTRRFDHGAIYLHIAGTYTPFTLLALRQEGYWGWSLFAVIWFAAVAGVWLSFRKMRKKDHLKTVCYLAMGWVVIIAFKPLLHVFRETGSMDVLYWLIGGGLFYTVGCLFFFLDKYKYMHPVWAVVSVILYRYTCWYNMFHLYLGLI